MAAIALNTSGLGEPEARAAIDSAARDTGLPVDDPVRFGSATFYSSLCSPICAPWATEFRKASGA